MNHVVSELDIKTLRDILNGVMYAIHDTELSGIQTEDIYIYMPEYFGAMLAHSCTMQGYAAATTNDVNRLTSLFGKRVFPYFENSIIISYRDIVLRDVKPYIIPIN